MKILAIETSCDETSASVIEAGGSLTRPKIKVLSNIIATQTEFHEKYGGIVPEIASRRHAEVINPVIEAALEKAKIDLSKKKALEAVAVAHAPGLIGSLIVGLSAAKALAYALKINLVGINHLEGHIYANFINDNPKFPFVALLVSGGHTMIVLVKGHGKYQILGQTRDDAVGEAYDKVARYIGLGFPGGPVIDRRAKLGNPVAFNFPMGMEGTKYGFDFSYSGLKTAVVNFTKKFGLENLRKDEKTLNDICASFQRAATQVLVEKTLLAAKKYKTKTIVLAGGVSANSELRGQLKVRGEENGFKVIIPPFEFCTDNAAMIGSAAFFRLKSQPKKAIKTDVGLELKALATLPLTSG